MAAIRKISNSKGTVWLADCYHAGKRIKRRFGKKSEAEAWLGAMGRAAISQEESSTQIQSIHGQGQVVDVKLAYKPLIYFIQAESGAIKIGFTTDLTRRFLDLSIANHAQLTVLGVIYGGQNQEKKLHRQFEHLNLKGEWFESALELLAFIEQNCQPSPIRVTAKPKGELVYFPERQVCHG